MKPLLDLDPRGLADLGAPFRELGEMLRETGWISAPLRRISVQMIPEISASIRETITQLEEASAPLRAVAGSLRETSASMAAIAMALDAPRLAQVPPKRGRGRPKGSGHVIDHLEEWIAEMDRLKATGMSQSAASRQVRPTKGSGDYLVRAYKDRLKK